MKKEAVSAMSKPAKELGPKVVKLRTAETRVSALTIAHQTARAIERGVYPPASRLREQELADLFNCSRAPVREALRILESRGLVVIEPMKGARVASIDDKSFFEVFLIRRALAGLLAEQLALAPESAARSKFIAMAKQLAELAEAEAPEEEFIEHVSRTIASFAAASALARVVQLIQSLTFGRQAFQAEFLSTGRRRTTIAKTWLRLAHAVESREPRKARDAIERLFDLAYRFVSVSIKADQLSE